MQLEDHGTEEGLDIMFFTHDNSVMVAIEGNIPLEFDDFVTHVSSRSISKRDNMNDFLINNMSAYKDIRNSLLLMEDPQKRCSTITNLQGYITMKRINKSMLGNIGAGMFVVSIFMLAIGACVTVLSDSILGWLGLGGGACLAIGGSALMQLAGVDPTPDKKERG